jgi:hypothetical protein
MLNNGGNLGVLTMDKSGFATVYVGSLCREKTNVESVFWSASYVDLAPSVDGMFGSVMLMAMV